MIQQKMFVKHTERVDKEYERMKEALPTAVAAILDIGCGYAMIDVFLARHYGGLIDVHLMDGDAESPMEGRKNRTGFRSKMDAWNDRHVGMEHVQRKVPGCRVYGHPPDPGLTIPCDLIISRRSWGHHYPVETYANLADRSLRKHGRIILDIRHDSFRVETRGVGALLSRGFRVISDDLEVKSVKCKRYVLGRYGEDG